ncbi:MAG: 5'/3'-nucleotidase SurE [Thermoanaerobacteraceae bacterium]|nr:5'/3'-nucleotidase SurE [Thermoanaerobacteraceae bacterium]
MNILITNDDGINSAGLITLAQEISKIADVTVVAPDRERSATANAITMHKPLRVEKVDIPGCEALGYMVNGTPSDCVKLALEALLDCTPDLVLSGINRGSNLGTDVIYSGTVSAAIEAALSDISAIALSVASYENVEFNYAANFAKNLCQQISNKVFPKDTLLNVNIPYTQPEKIAGIAVTHLGTVRYKNSFERRTDPRGRAYYWLAGEVIQDTNDKGSDVWAIKNNFISITPILLDLTKYDIIETIKEWNLQA